MRKEKAREAIFRFVKTGDLASLEQAMKDKRPEMLNAQVAADVLNHASYRINIKLLIFDDILLHAG